MRTDAQIQKDVIEEIKWEPAITSSEIGVSVSNGIVTLSGQVSTYSEKLHAEEAAKRIAGVKAIAEDIHVGVSTGYTRTDTEIAQAVLNALKWHTDIPDYQMSVKVEDGQVKLEGEVEWEFQRQNAKKVIENLAGIRSVINLIKVTPKIAPTDIQKKITAAFHRSATIDAQKIKAEVSGSKVTLKGRVRSISEKEDAENAAWAAPGVFSIDNQLEIGEPELVF
ncbi:MAG: BON domain-containing protein [Bacteroidetes bacterium]|jgi:osmotically-inducible protein OsmY|nr:BON domain-containing protein [Bacteroidota bacterium]